MGTITPAQCLHYVLDLPVSTVVPGVKDVQELEAALGCWEASEAEKAAGGVTDALRSEYAALAVKASACVECSACL